jgi:hypothetical protein
MTARSWFPGRADYERFIASQGSTSASVQKSTGTSAMSVKSQAPVWLADSGASSHITGDSTLFSSLRDLVTPFQVKVADGGLSPVTGLGNLSISSTLPLSNVMHAPRFALNWISISQITRDLRCRAIFYDQYFVLQDLQTMRQIGGGLE